MSDNTEGWYWVRDSVMTHGVWSPEYVWRNGLIKSLATTINDIEVGCRIPPPDEIWRPIDTAPRDGTRVIGYNRHVVTEICWLDEPDDNDHAGWCESSFCSGGILREVNNVMSPEPTHWMPLPEPPK